MGLKAFWQKYRENRARKFLHGNADAALAVLRQDPGLAAHALHGLYAGDAGLLSRMQEIDALRGAPQRESFQFPVLSSMGFGGRQPLQRTLPKLTPWNLRRFSEYPPARRAINAIKLPLLDLPFSIGLKKPVGAKSTEPEAEPTAEQQERIIAATELFLRPNDEYSGRELWEMVIEDLLILGGGTFEARENTSDDRPLFLWAVDSQSVRINVQWTPGSSEFRYSQGRGYLFGAAGTNDDVKLQDEDLCYMKLNPRTSTPFGLGYLEVAFSTVNSFIGSFEYAERRASNSTPNYLIFLGENATAEQVTRFRHYWENEIEGYGKIPIMGGGRAPGVHPFVGDTTDPLFLKWQEWNVRIIAMCFGLSPMRLGLERDVNRSTSEQGAADDWATIAPVAHAVELAMTSWILWKRLGWTDLEFGWKIKTSDEEKQARILALQWESDAIYVDELREVYERPPLPDGLGQMTRTAYESAIKAAAMLPAPGQTPNAEATTTSEETASLLTPFDDLDERFLAPRERAFLREQMRERRLRDVAG